ncbi:MAG: ABC transporter permease, partial [Gemmatimonadetes bacterium]|nr:ABC transporter permease [Gemmatimonadota bacterium]
MLTDLRYALRLLARSPRFTALTVLVLAGGLAVAIFTFSFLYTALLRPLPLPGGSEIVRVQQKLNGSTRSLDAADVALMRPAVRTLAGMGAYTSRTFVAGEADRGHVVSATVTEWNIFEVTGTRPLLGRGLSPDDHLPGAQPVIVLAHRTWEALFGGDPQILDRAIILNGTRTRIVGVMPAGYAFPVATDGWAPMEAELLAPAGAGVSFVNLYGRLAAGTTAEETQAELDGLLLRARSTYDADSEPGQHVSTAVRTFPMAQFDGDGPMLLIVLNLLAALILLLACINVTNLLLARANERAREVAVRMALGASPARLIMQSMWESVLLCLFGGALAIALAAWSLDFINVWAHRNMPGNLAFWWVWQLEPASLVAAGVFITITMAVLAGVVASRTMEARFTSVLRDAGARSGAR